MAEKIIYAISDSLGETAEAVARATASQYDKRTKLKLCAFLISIVKAKLTKS